MLILYCMAWCIVTHLSAGLTELYIQASKKDPSYRMTPLDISLIDEYLSTFFTTFNLAESLNEHLDRSHLTHLVRHCEEQIVQILQQKNRHLFSRYIKSTRTFNIFELLDNPFQTIITDITQPHAVEYNKRRSSFFVFSDDLKLKAAIPQYPSVPKLVQSIIPCAKENINFIIRQTFILDQPYCIDLWSTIDEAIIQSIPLEFIPSKIIHGYLQEHPCLVIASAESDDAIVYEKRSITQLKSTMLVSKMASSSSHDDQDVQAWHRDWIEEFQMLPDWIKKEFPHYRLKHVELETKKSSPGSLRTPRIRSLNRIPSIWMPNTPKQSNSPTNSL